MDDFFDDSVDQFLATMKVSDIENIYEDFDDDSMDQFLATMKMDGAKKLYTDAFDEDSMDWSLSRMPILTSAPVENFDEDSMDFHLARMDIPVQVGVGADDEDQPNPKRAKTGSSSPDDLQFNVRLDRRMKPLVARHLNATEDTYVYQIDHNLSTFLEGIKDRNVASFSAIGPKIDSLFLNLVEPHREKMAAGDYLSIQVSHEQLERDIYVSYSFRDKFKSTSFLDKISALSQSDKTIFLNNGQLTIKITHYKGIRGSGKGRGSTRARPPVTSNKYFQNKKSVAQIKNNDHSCGYLAIALGKILADDPEIIKNQTSYWDSLLRPDRPGLRRSILAPISEDLFTSLGIDTTSPLDQDKLKAIQEKLPEYQITVIPRPTMSLQSKSRMFHGDFKPKRIILEFVER